MPFISDRLTHTLYSITYYNCILTDRIINDVSVIKNENLTIKKFFNFTNQYYINDENGDCIGILNKTDDDMYRCIIINKN